MITTASPHNHDLLRRLGADAVFDYHDPEVTQKIKTWVKEKGYENGIERAFDTISEYGPLNHPYDPRGRNFNATPHL